MKTINFIIILLLLSTCLYSQNEDYEKQKDIFKNKGIFNITKVSLNSVNSANLLVRNQDNSVSNESINSKGGNAAGLTTIFGYFLNSHFSLGIGLGFERFNKPNSNTFPIFLDVRYYLEDDYNSLYIFANGGILSKFSDDFNKGGGIQGGIGYKFFIDSKKSIALISDIGYYHRLIKLPSPNNPKESDLTLNGLTFSIGVLF